MHVVPIQAVETELLIRCAGLSSTPQDREAIEALLERQVDWPAFVQLTRAHGVAPIVASNLRRIGGDKIPRGVRDTFSKLALRNAARNLVLTNRLVQIFDCLRSAGIEAIAFKGPTLSIRAYGQLCLREFNDLDLLMRPDDISAACGELASLGYSMEDPGRKANPALDTKLQCETVLVNEADATVVEPHWAIAPPCMQFGIDYRGLFARAGTIVIEGGGTVPMLAIEDEFLVVCAHGSKHQWTSLKWICDVAAFADRRVALDWELVLARARGQGCERMCLIGIGVAADLFNVEFPQAVRDRLARDRTARALSAEVRRTLFQPTGARHSAPTRVSLFRMRMRERWYDQLAYLIQTLMTPATSHIAFVSLPARWSFLYVFVVPTHDYIVLPMYRLYRRFARLVVKCRARASGRSRIGA